VQSFPYIAALFVSTLNALPKNQDEQPVPVAAPEKKEAAAA